MPEVQYVVVIDRSTWGVAPCGATFGTAAGPNDGQSACAVCGAVHPVQIGCGCICHQPERAHRDSMCCASPSAPLSVPAVPEEKDCGELAPLTAAEILTDIHANSLSAAMQAVAAARPSVPAVPVDGEREVHLTRIAAKMYASQPCSSAPHEGWRRDSPCADAACLMHGNHMPPDSCVHGTAYPCAVCTPGATAADLEEIRREAAALSGLRPEPLHPTHYAGTCDWGGCDDPMVALRWTDLGWLPVCGPHISTPEDDASVPAVPEEKP